MLRLTDARGVRRCPAVLPRLAIRLDLFALLDVQRLPALIVLQRRTLKVHAESCRPACRRVRAGTPPDSVAQAFRMRLEAQQPGRIGKHRPRVGLREAFTFQELQEHLGVAACHVTIALALSRRIPEVAPAIDHLLRRAAADPQLKPSARNQVCRARVLRHIQRVLVAHVDHGRADLDRPRPRANRRTAAGTANRVGARNGERGSTRRRRPAPRRQRRARSTAATSQ